MADTPKKEGSVDKAAGNASAADGQASSSQATGGYQPEEIAAGTLLIQENETSRRMFIIKKGKARVFKRYLGQKVSLAILGEGEIFGELSFFDGEPRSASVEALTAMSVVVVDGDRAQREIAGLPSWVIPVFRAAFGRLREADQRLTVLQSTHEFQKKAFKHDATAKAVLGELIRFSKTLVLLYERLSKETGKADSNTLYSDLEGVLGQRLINLRMYWRQLLEMDFLDDQVDPSGAFVSVHTAALQGFIAWAFKEHEKEKIIFPSHTCLAVTRRILSLLLGEVDNITLQAPDRAEEISMERLDAKTIHEFDRGLDELLALGFVKMKESAIAVNAFELNKFYTYLSIAKAFDLSVAMVD